jgi:hypothetical protein
MGVRKMAIARSRLCMSQYCTRLFYYCRRRTCVNKSNHNESTESDRQGTRLTCIRLEALLFSKTCTRHQLVSKREAVQTQECVFVSAPDVCVCAQCPAHLDVHLVLMSTHVQCSLLTENGNRGRTFGPRTVCAMSFRKEERRRTAREGRIYCRRRPTSPRVIQILCQCVCVCFVPLSRSVLGVL